jgi:hypothetical protein
MCFAVIGLQLDRFLETRFSFPLTLRSEIDRAEIIVGLGVRGFQ